MATALQAEPEGQQGTIALAATMALIIGLIRTSPTPRDALAAVLHKLVTEGQDRGWLPPVPPGASAVLIFPSGDQAVPPPSVMRH